MLHDNIVGTDVDGVAKHNTVAYVKKTCGVVKDFGEPVDGSVGFTSDRRDLVLKLLDTLQSIIKLIR